MVVSEIPIHSTQVHRVPLGEGNLQDIVLEVVSIPLNRKVGYTMPTLRLRFDTRTVCVRWVKLVTSMETVFVRMLWNT